MVGAQVWLEDATEAWIEGEITEVNGDNIKVHCTTGKTVSTCFDVILGFYLLGTVQRHEFLFQSNNKRIDKNKILSFYYLFLSQLYKFTNSYFTHLESFFAKYRLLSKLLVFILKTQRPHLVVLMI